MTRLVAPSILAADFGNLGNEIDMLNNSNADWIHCDIMDGVFVPNISFGFPVVEYVKKQAKKPLDVHLMIVDPDRYLKQFRDAGADILTVQYEACIHLNRTISAIKELGMTAGVAINPHTPVSMLTDILQIVDMVLVMTVNPGYGGQSFIPRSYNKIRELRAMANELNPQLLIEVDGGIGLQNADDLCQAGVNVLVAGTTVFKSENPQQTINSLKGLR